MRPPQASDRLIAMTRAQAIAQIQSTLPVLADEQISALAEVADALAQALEPEDDATRSAIREGLDQANSGRFASPAEVAAAFAKFRTA